MANSDLNPPADVEVAPAAVETSSVEPASTMPVKATLASVNPVSAEADPSVKAPEEVVVESMEGTAEELFAKGAELQSSLNFPEALKVFSFALKKAVETFGELHLDTAPYYTNYAECLLEIFRLSSISTETMVNTDVVEDKEDLSDEEQDDEEENEEENKDDSGPSDKMDVDGVKSEAAETKPSAEVSMEEEKKETDEVVVGEKKENEAVEEEKNDNESGEEEAEGDEEEQEDENEARQEETSDLKLAWENLDVARLIYSKALGILPVESSEQDAEMEKNGENVVTPVDLDDKTKEKLINGLVTTLLVIADVAMEDGKVDVALHELDAANNALAMLPSQEPQRLKASIYHKQCIANEILNKFEEARVCLEKSRDVFVQMKDFALKEGSSDSAKIQEWESIIAEIDRNIENFDASAKDYVQWGEEKLGILSKISQLSKNGESSGESSGQATNGFDKPLLPTTATESTVLEVKRKRKAEDEVEEANEGKRVKEV